MRTNNKKKSGFTLVELMIVAAIIAILAAIIVPMLTSNKDRAIAAEASNICGMIATECKVIFASGSDWPSAMSDLSSVTEDEVDNAKYFSGSTITMGATSGTELDTWWVQISGGAADFSGGANLTLRLVSGGTFSGTMVDEKLVSP